MNPFKKLDNALVRTAVEIFGKKEIIVSYCQDKQDEFLNISDIRSATVGLPILFGQIIFWLLLLYFLANFFIFFPNLFIALFGLLIINVAYKKRELLNKIIKTFFRIILS